MTRNIHVDASVGKPWEILNHCAAYSRAVFKLTKRLHRVEDSYGVGRLCHNVTLTHLEPISLRSESSGHPRTDSHCHSGRASIGRNIVAGVMAIIVMSGNGVGTMWLYSTSFLPQETADVKRRAAQTNIPLCLISQSSLPSWVLNEVRVLVPFLFRHWVPVHPVVPIPCLHESALGYERSVSPSPDVQSVDFLCDITCFHLRMSQKRCPSKHSSTRRSLCSFVRNISEERPDGRSSKE